MFTSTWLNRLPLSLILAGVLGACAGPQLAVEPIAPSENPSEQINRFDADLTTSREQQINVLAPISFGAAEAALTAARTALEGGAGVADILQHVALGRAQLQRAQGLAQVARTTLPDVIQARTRAREANASSLGDDYEAAEAQFLALTKAVENDRLAWAQRNQTKLSQRFHDLEVRAIKTQTLGEVRQLLAQADRNKLQRLAPNTYALAKEALQDADTFISEHPYEKDRMRQKAQAALFLAQRLQHVAQQSQRVITQQPEDTALWMETLLETITMKLGAPDMRNHALETQVDNIMSSIVALQEERRFLSAQQQAQQTELASLQQRMAELEGQTQQERAAKERLAREGQAMQARLAAERRLQRTFDAVAAQFDAGEAEVYTQGNRLVIRLQAMQFPIAQAVIMPEHYALLGKVQRAIRQFNGSDVVIAGHTDSTGAEATNQHLSERRADAVRAYLVAHGTLKQDRITAVGYGEARPLASNSSAEGRAKNRRIDVMITPKQTPQP